MTPEHERWAEAHTVLELHGDKVFDVIADRIGTLARTGDEAGVMLTRKGWRSVQHFNRPDSSCRAA